MTSQIQTVHGITHPVVVQYTDPEGAGDESEPSTQQYREVIAERLDRVIDRAKVCKKSDAD